jgi:ribosomal protein L36
MTSPIHHGYRSPARTFALLAAIAPPLATLTLAQPAEARIKCVNGNQIVNGSPIATPYCQDELVAVVARERGMKVSASEIRNNPNLKRNVCQHVGRDNRIYIACIDANSVGRRPF